MQPPRWFYAIIAGCAIVLTLSASYVLILRRDVGRWVAAGPADDLKAFDTSTGTVCLITTGANPSAGCIDFPHGTVNRLEKRTVGP